MSLEQAPPRNLEAERSVLGACMIERSALEDVDAILRPGMFYLESHRLIFRCMLDLMHRNEPVDLVTVTDELRRNQRLEMAGGTSYLVELADPLQLTANVEHHAQVVRGDAMLRQMIIACSAGLSACYGRDESADDIISGIEARVLSVAEHRGRDLANPADSASQAVQVIRRGDIGQPWHIPALTAATGGGQRRGEYTLLLGFRGHGKTRFALSQALEDSRSGRPHLLFSYEMTRTQLEIALIAVELGVPLEQLINPTCGIPEDDIAAAAERVGARPLYIVEANGYTVDDVQATARRARKRYGIDRISIDYAQKIRPEKGTEKRTDDLTSIAVGVKSMALSLNVPVLLLAQPTIEATGKKRAPADIPDVHPKDCRAFEDEAESVLYLHRPSALARKDDLMTQERWAGRGLIAITKCRHSRGGSGQVLTVGFDETIGLWGPLPAADGDLPYRSAPGPDEPDFGDPFADDPELQGLM